MPITPTLEEIIELGVDNGLAEIFVSLAVKVVAIDLAANKDFDLTAGVTMYMRVDLFNVFNFKNYSDFATNWGANGIYNPVVMAVTSGNMYTYPRTLKFQLGFRF